MQSIVGNKRINHNEIQTLVSLWFDLLVVTKVVDLVEEGTSQLDVCVPERVLP